MIYKKISILLLVFAISFSGCSAREAITENDFVGKWESSRTKTPIYLYGNGEWEIKTDDGSILEFGVWQFRNEKIIWSFKAGSEIMHDPNPVLSVTPREFKLREQDSTITVFSRHE